MKVFIFPLLMLVFLAGCTKSSSHQSESAIAKTQEVPKPVVEPKPYKRAELSRNQLRVLDNSLPKKAQQILEQADEFEISYLPAGHEGKIQIKDVTERMKLLDSIYSGIAEAYF